MSENFEEKSAKEAEQLKDKKGIDQVIEDGKLKVEIFQREAFVRNNFTYQQHNYLNQSLRFADAKAGALTAANGLITKFVYDASSSNRVVELLFLCGLFIIIIGLFFSLMVVFPKNLNRKDKGIVYWEHIVNTGEKEYINTIKKGELSNLLEKSIGNNYSQALILTKKFKRLNQAFKISILGYVLIFIGLIIMWFLNSVQ